MWYSIPSVSTGTVKVEDQGVHAGIRSLAISKRSCLEKVAVPNKAVDSVLVERTPGKGPDNPDSSIFDLLKMDLHRRPVG